MQDYYQTPPNPHPYRKAIIICISIILLTILIIIGYNLIQYLQKPSYLDIMVTPLSSTIKVNGEEYRNATYVFKPGEYQVEITSNNDNFKSQSLIITVENHSVANLHVALPTDNLAWYESNPDDLYMLQLINPSDEETQQFLKNYEHKLSLKDLLPLSSYEDLPDGETTVFGGTEYYTHIYDATDNENCTAPLCLLIDTNTNDNTSAQKLLKDAGNYNLSDYQIFHQTY